MLPHGFSNVLWRTSAGLAAVLLSICLLTAAKPPKTKPGKAKAKAERTDTVEDLFTSTQVFRIRIEISEKDMDVLRGYRWEGFQGAQVEKRPSVKGTVREGDRVYNDVAIHLKGAAGSFRSIDDEPALTLNFDKNVKGQTFHGVQRISLNNSVQDRSLLNEEICRELFAKADIPVPRATHAQVELNGRNLGVYVLVEAFNKQFLARHFKSAKGNLYDGGFVKDVRDQLEKSSGTNPNDRSDLARLAEAAEEPDSSIRVARLKQVLDWDRFVRYLALDVMMCNWDGYAVNRNNYRIYHDPATDKIVFMPHGLDQMFGVMRVGTDMALFPRMQGLVANAVMQTPEGRKEYRAQMGQLLTNLFQLAPITNRIWQLTAQIAPALAEQGAGVARAQNREAADFCRRIEQRIEFIRERLSAPDISLKFEPDGFARLPEWRPRSEFGKPSLDESTEDGKALLHIQANGSSVGIWSAKVRLEPGRYRLEGKAKGAGVVLDAGDRRGGVMVRTSGRRFVQKVMADNTWRDVRLDFEVGDESPQFGFMNPIEDSTPDIDLICELRAAKGDVWFDKGSLRLSRR
jgi:spore coat protein H